MAKIQQPAPTFKGVAVLNNHFIDIDLEHYLGKYVVLFFYPLDFTFVCPTEIVGFSDRIEDFEKLNTAVIACSTDSQYCHLAWKNLPRTEGGIGDIKLPLLSDKSGHIARAYGVLNEETGIPYRGLFIIDKRGILRQITINDLPVGRSVDETIRLVQALQFTDKHGEVCPAGWSPGQKTIKPNPKESKEYFKSANKVSNVI